jgi:hypothetical protein
MFGVGGSLSRRSEASSLDRATVFVFVVSFMILW